ncbi:MAG: gamma-glutamyl-gamma-aminobutyrate hydrolase family protein [Candidatus Ventricola sp.]
MGKRPVIGISASRSEEQHRLSLAENYLNAIYRAGGLPMVFPSSIADEGAVDEMLDLVDGVLLSGGIDVHPRYFGEEILPGCGAIDETRDAFELALTRRAIERGMPVLGICRGIQVLAIALGGSIFQDIESQLGIPNSEHRLEAMDDYKHAVRFKEGGLFERITGTTLMLTNSMHHQSVKDAGDKLIIEGITMDGIIEAVSMAGNEAVLGVQFHPECLESFSDPAARIFAYFVGKAAEYRA